MSRYGYAKYVPVAARRANALKKMAKLRKKGLDVRPVTIEGRKISKTFWGQAWCDHLESFSDFENRLPRGRTYVRNGSVCHLSITEGKVEAMVSGSSLYTVTISVKGLTKKKWESIKTRCAGKIGSLLELLRGELSSNVMTVVTDRKAGLFPLPGEIDLSCSCPDWATMCKHVAAALYGVAARFDDSPELLFLLRGVNQEELISVEVEAAALEGKSDRKRIADSELGDVFGIEITEDVVPKTRKTALRQKKAVPGKSGETAVTGKTIARLRARFGMSRSDFAVLLGVSTGSVANWERNSGKLRLQSRTLKAFNAVKNLTKKEAQRLSDS